MHFVRTLGFVVVVAAVAACGQRQPAEAPASPAPAPVTETAVEAPPTTEIAAIPESQPSLPEENPFPDAPLSEELRDKVWPRSPLDNASALFEEWRGVINNEEEESRTLRLQMLGRAIANLGPDACAPLFAVMADEDEEPMTRYLVVMTLEDWVVPTFLPALEPLVDPEQDDATRSYAAYLIARLESGEAVPVLERLAEDENRRIQFGAQLGLARLRQPAYEEILFETFRDADAIPEERASIAILFAERIDPFLTDFYLEAAADPTLGTDARGYCLQSLSQLADPSTVPELQAIAQNPELEDQRDAANYALRNIELHQSGVVQPFPQLQ